MDGRDIYFANNTNKLLKQVFPADFKMVKDKTSNGYKLSNLLYGVEIDLIWDRFEQLRNDNYLHSLDYSEDPDTSTVYLDASRSGVYLWGLADSSDVPVRVTNRRQFDTGIPTRLSNIGTLTISGVDYGYVGLEYFRSNRRGDGFILTSLNEDMSILYPAGISGVHKISSDNIGNFQTWNYSGENPGILEQSYSVVGRYEMFNPLTAEQLAEEYPLTRNIRAPESGVINSPEITYTIDHYTPYNGYYWDTETSIYKAVGYPTERYFDKEYESYRYYRTALNNPYGSGNYTTVYLNLEHVPISGTLKIFDIDALDPSGNAIEIPQLGKQLYYYEGVYNSGVAEHTPEYLGYDAQVPPMMTLDGSGVPTGAPFTITTWDYCRESGGLGEDLVWTEYPTNKITNRIQITNPYSRYIAEYKYYINKNIKFITSTNSTPYVRIEDENYIHTINDISENLRLTTDFRFSKDPRPEKTALTFDGWARRPGSTIGKVQVDVDLSTQSAPLVDSITLPLDKEPIGYTFKSSPNRVEYKTTIVDQLFDGNNTFNLTNTSGSVVDIINYHEYYGSRMRYSGSGDTYYSISGYYGCRNAVVNNIRSIDLAFKYYTSNISDSILAQSSNSIDFWRITLLANGRFQIDDPDYSLYSFMGLVNNNQNYRIIVQRDVGYERGSSDTMFRLYVKAGNAVFKEWPLTLKDNPNTVPPYTRTDFFVNCTLDIKHAKIYEEPRGYVVWPTS